MDIKELLDEEELDPKKLFNEKEYSTLIINREGFSKKENSVADLIEELLEPNLGRERYEAIFSELKEKNAAPMLVDAIRSSQKNTDTATLIAACWECGMDFSEFLPLFAELVYHSDFQVALEALSVVESTEAASAGQVAAAVAATEKLAGPHEQLIEDLKKHLTLLGHA